MTDVGVKKYSKTVSMSEKMLAVVREREENYMTRSAFIEKMFWEGVRACKTRDNNEKLQVS